MLRKIRKKVVSVVFVEHVYHWKGGVIIRRSIGGIQVTCTNDATPKYYDSIIHDALSIGLPVSLFIADDGYLGVRIGDVDFPYFPWETFEDQIPTITEPGPEREMELLCVEQIQRIIDQQKGKCLDVTSSVCHRVCCELSRLRSVEDVDRVLVDLVKTLGVLRVRLMNDQIHTECRGGGLYPLFMLGDKGLVSEADVVAFAKKEGVIQ